MVYSTDLSWKQTLAAKLLPSIFWFKQFVLFDFDVQRRLCAADAYSRELSGSSVPTQSGIRLRFDFLINQFHLFNCDLQ